MAPTPTIYSHSMKLSEGSGGAATSSAATNDDDGNDDGETTRPAHDATFSFALHLYAPPAGTNDATIKFQHSNLSSFLKSSGGALPSAKRLKNWKRPRSPMVLVVTLSARRSVELTKQLGALKLPVAKLFAKHMVVEEQAELLGGAVGGAGKKKADVGGGGAKGRGRCYSLAVGTPGRLLKLLRHGMDDGGSDGTGGALRLDHTEVVVIDCHEDSKGWNVCTLKDTSRELMELLREGVVPQLERRKGKMKLALF